MGIKLKSNFTPFLGFEFPGITLSKNYDNVSKLLRLLNLDEFPFPLQFAGDLKLIASICGLSGCSGRHSCYACNGCKLDENNEPTNKKTGKFHARKELRTFGHFACTIYKSQGQTLKYAGIWLRSPDLTH